MIDPANITKEDEKLFFDIQFYLELYVEYIMTIRDARYEKDEKFKKISFKELFEKYVFPKYDYLKKMLPFISPKQYIFISDKTLIHFDVGVDDKMNNLLVELLKLV